MEKFYNDLVSDYKDGTKEGEVMGKYTGTEAIDQMNKCLTDFSEKSKLGDDFKWPKAAEAAAGEMEMMGMEEMMAEAEAMEGGEEMAAEMGGEMMMEEAAMAKKMQLVAADAFGECEGPTELPKLLLSLMFVYPVFGDAVKAQTVQCELGGDNYKDFAAIATMVGAFAKSQCTEDGASFGMAVLCEEDLEELKEIETMKTDSALVFPGIVGAWADQADAEGQCNAADGKTKVLFKFNGKTKKFGDKLVVMNRAFAKLDSLEAPTDSCKYYVATLSDFADHVFETVEEYTKAVTAAAEAAAAVADEVKDAMEGDKMMEGEMMMEGEAGEMMGDGM